MPDIFPASSSKFTLFRGSLPPLSSYRWGNFLNLSGAMRIVRMQGPAFLDIETWQPVLFEEWLDDGKLVHKEFLILGAAEIVMCPQFGRDVSADKEDKPADLLRLFLNDVK